VKQANRLMNVTLPAVAALAVMAAQQGKADDFMIPLELPSRTSSAWEWRYPDYLGSNDTAVGVAPFARLSLAVIASSA